MTALLIDIVIAFWLLLFGGMAIFPLVPASFWEPSREPEDQVLSIEPVRGANDGDTLADRMRNLARTGHTEDRI